MNCIFCQKTETILNESLMMGEMQVWTGMIVAFLVMYSYFHM